MIQFEDIPFQYGFCLNDNCPMAATCLRQLALASVPEHQHFITVLHPKKYIRQDANCDAYRSNVKALHARGFKRILRTFPINVLDSFRNNLIGIFPRNKYFKMRRGDILLTPEEQNLILRIARKHGFQGEFTFDSYEEAYLW